jgi:hypothetical protein
MPAEEKFSGKFSGHKVADLPPEAPRTVTLVQALAEEEKCLAEATNAAGVALDSITAGCSFVNSPYGSSGMLCRKVKAEDSFSPLHADVVRSSSSSSADETS